MTRFKFTRDDRLRRQADFDRVYKAKVYAADDVLVVNGVRNDLAHTRLGLSVSRKVGNAVVRNRWKRRIREAFRLQRQTFPAGLDIVVRPKLGAVCDYHAIAKSLPQLVVRVAKRLAGSAPRTSEPRP